MSKIYESGRIGNLNGTWVFDTSSPWGGVLSVTFYGRVFTANKEASARIFGRNEECGTFSFNDNEIEFVLSNGTIVVRSFSHTENTIELGETRFTRE